MKIEIDEVEAKLLEKRIEPAKVQEIIRELEEVAEELNQTEQPTEEVVDADGLPVDGGAEAGEKVKFEYVIVLHDKNDYLKDKEIAGWVIQQEENADAGLVLSKLIDAAKDQNETAKRKKNTITDIAGAFESLKSKFTKNKKIKIKTKDLTRVIVTNGNF